MLKSKDRELEFELRKLTSKPLLTIDEFEKLIPMLISDDKEIVRLGIELFKTYDYKDLRLTISSLSAYVGVNMGEFDINWYCFNNNVLDELCNRKLNFAFHKKFEESVRR